jgi:hypothetical protein
MRVSEGEAAHRICKSLQLPIDAGSAVVPVLCTSLQCTCFPAHTAPTPLRPFMPPTTAADAWALHRVGPIEGRRAGWVCLPFVCVCARARVIYDPTAQL